VSEAVPTAKRDDTWSIKENIGYLGGLEGL
jgi:hypothetical protein